MQRIVIAVSLSLISTAFLAPDPADAARRNRNSSASKTTVSRSVDRGDQIYYGRTNRILLDQAAPTFASPPTRNFWNEQERRGGH